MTGETPPQGRTTRLTSKARSNSNTISSMSLADLQNLIVSSKNEMISIMRSEIEKINQTLSSLTGRIDVFEQKLTQICEKQDKQDTELANLKESFQHFSVDYQRELLQEAESRFGRCQNIIIRGLEEPSTGTEIERKTEDENKLHNLLQHLQVQNVQVKDIRRIGKSRVSSPRLLKLTINDDGKRLELIKKSSSLRNSSLYSGIFVNFDLTPLQQNEQRLLREELRQGRLSVIIRRGKVQRRVDAAQNFH